jgi:hypothetical protein
MKWVMMAYRLPREPSTPRIALWRRLRRLGAAQILDGLVALPDDNATREQLDWLAESIVEAGGEATIWIAEAGSARQEQELKRLMSAAVADEYREITSQANGALRQAAPARRRTLERLRREMRRVAGRDYFPPPERETARAAVAQLAEKAEVS